MSSYDDDFVFRWFVANMVILGLSYTLLPPPLSFIIPAMSMMNVEQDYKWDNLKSFFNDIGVNSRHITIDEKNRLKDFEYHMSTAMYGIPQERKQASRAILKNEWGIIVKED